MSKPLTILETFVLRCETAQTYRFVKRKIKEDKFLLSRLHSVPPSSKFMDDIIHELELRIDEQLIEIRNMINKFISNSPYKEIEFEDTFYHLSSKDIYNGYIPLFVKKECIKENEPSQYICFFRPYNNGIIRIQIGEIKPDPEASTLIEILEKDLLWKKGTKDDLRTKHINKLYAELMKPKKKRRY